MREKTDFKNPFYLGANFLNKATRVPVTTFHKLKMWKEFYFRYKETCEAQEYYMDREEQLDLRAAKMQDLIR